MSLGGRRSSVAPNRSTGQIKDPRTFTDKAFKDRSVRKLIQYLLDHGYDRTLSPQLLTAPSTKDFVYIISFLLKAAVPNFEFNPNAKFEEEIPAILKALGYPVNIPKSSLQSVGAPHAWPPILAALAWLVDLVNYSEAAASESNNEAFDGDEDGNKMFFDYLKQGYALFLAGEDDLSPLEEQVAFTFETKNASLKADIASLTTANADLTRQHAELTEGDTPLQKAQAHNRDLESDTAKFEKHISDLGEHQAKVSDKLAAEQQEGARIQEELSKLLAENAVHKETIAAQEMTPADVRRMHDEREHLETELSRLQAYKEQLSKQLWDEELVVKETLDRLDGNVQQANNCSLRLHLIPANAKNAKGVSHEMALHKSALDSNPDGLLGGVDTRGTLLPGLQRVKEGVAREVSSAQDELLQSEEELSRREAQAGERQEMLKSLRGDLDRLEAQEKRLRDDHARELQELKTTTEALEVQIEEARSTTGQSMQAAETERKALAKELAEFTEAAARTREKMNSQLVSSLDMLTLHKETLETALRGLKDHCDAKMEALAPLLDLKEAVEVQ